MRKTFRGGARASGGASVEADGLGTVPATANAVDEVPLPLPPPFDFSLMREFFCWIPPGRKADTATIRSPTKQTRQRIIAHHPRVNLWKRSRQRAKKKTDEKKNNGTV
mmetsp:Transcript_3951/g.5439  ORF Transcript_3951/g.5439 Transcript_3951/m.5439 type:complete len:108 (+) Transcript_3951:2281-2604(+)